MKDGFIKAAAGTPEIRTADCRYNAQSIIDLMKAAAKEDVQLLVLPELCVTGYTCGDLFLQQTLIEGAKKALGEIVRASEGVGMLVTVGLPVVNHGKLYNCAAVLCDGKVLGIVPKTHLPNYGEFYEKRQFTAAVPGFEYIAAGVGEDTIPFGTNLLFDCDELTGLTVAVEICEDLWACCPPSVSHAAAGATVIANLSASNETVGKTGYRRDLICGQSARLVCGYIYANAGGGESTTDVVFAGKGLIAENGALLAEGRRYETGLTITELDIQRLAFDRRRMTTYPEADDKGYCRICFSLPVRDTKLTRHISSSPFIPEGSSVEECLEDILLIQAHGLKKRLEHSRAKTAVVGISGGLDSALALLVAVRAMDLLNRPRTDVVAVTMPCFGTTARTKGNAEVLSECLGAELRHVDITQAVEGHFADIGHDISVHDVTFENAQARERTQVLMDIANRTNGLVVGTGDLSELALGWATYNGDHMSMYGVNASIPKTLIRHIVHYEAQRTENVSVCEVLLDILATPVSPELLPPREGEIDQKTEDLVGPYELHDFFIYYALRWGFTPRKILRLAEYAFGSAYTREVIVHWLKVFYRRFFAQQFKRSCLPDGPKVGSVSLSPRGDWRMPSDASSALWLEQLEDL